MPKKDLSQLAKSIVDQATGEYAPLPEESTRIKASRKGGGLKGGVARANQLTAEQRADIARLAAQTRWKKSS